MTTDTKVAELLPCPFCGSELTINSANLGAHPRFSDCIFAQQVIVVDDASQVTKWNRRAALARQEAGDDGMCYCQEGVVCPACERADYRALHAHLLDMLGVDSHEAAGAEIGRLHAAQAVDLSIFRDAVEYAHEYGSERKRPERGRLLALIDQQAGKGVDRG